MDLQFFNLVDSCAIETEQHKKIVMKSQRRRSQQDMCDVLDLDDLVVCPTANKKTAHIRSHQSSRSWRQESRCRSDSCSSNDSATSSSETETECDDRSCPNSPARKQFGGNLATRTASAAPVPFLLGTVANSRLVKRRKKLGRY
eukprot:m.75525 g.75525  ORF g.75525 m.75525 type:complete len:144 (-) comp20523_c0_seq2:445-876(-)